MPFTHEPRAPEVSADHPNQRYFVGAGGDERWVGDVVRVMRFADESAAMVDIRTGYSGKSRGDLTARLTASELRDFAARLLDAAHDLETHAAA